MYWHRYIFRPKRPKENTEKSPSHPRNSARNFGIASSAAFSPASIRATAITRRAPRIRATSTGTGANRFASTSNWVFILVANAVIESMPHQRQRAIKMRI